MRVDGQCRQPKSKVATGFESRAMWQVACLCAGSLLGISMSACETPSVIGDPHLLSFLQDGSTTRQDVYEHLTEPSATFEAGRIFIYMLDKDEGGYILVHRNAADWTGKYSLVLAFDEGGVLQRHSMLRVRTTPKSP